MALSREHGAAIERLRTVMSAPKAEAYVETSPLGAGGGVTPFVTLARQAWAGGHVLAERLARRLTALGVGHSPWTVWDNELVEKVAAESQIAREVIEQFENATPSYLQEFLSGMLVPTHEHVGQFTVYRRLAITIRALAQAGQVIIVGRGGVFITRRMPGGVHLWLVADHEWRVRHAAAALGLSHDQAAHRVHEVDRGRAGFYRRFWPNRPLSPELFHLTVNVELLPEERAVDCAVPLVQAVAEHTAAFAGHHG